MLPKMIVLNNVEDYLQLLEQMQLEYSGRYHEKAVALVKDLCWPKSVDYKL